jgi:6-pyruvoyltetrahydropterin/6-carboxytetrahydropterin synthase
MPTWEISRDFTFDAAHRLPHHDGKCKSLHGHTYHVRITVESPRIRETGSMCGMVVDYGVIKAAWKAIEGSLDHRNLNDLFSNPTAEHLAAWLFDQLSPALHGLSAITVWETPTSSCTYRP